MSISGNLGELMAGEPGRTAHAYSGDLRVRPHGRGIRLSGSVESTLSLMCDRCAQPYDLPVTGEVDVLLSDAIDASGYSGDSVLVVLGPEDNCIDLANPLRDALLLELPQKRLCRSDCKGLCPHCGKNLNEGSCSCEALAQDVRWAPLLDIKRKLERA